MNRLHLRFVVIASLLSIGLLLRPSSFATADEAKPQESRFQATPPAETRQLRQKVEALRHRIEQLEKEKTAIGSNRHGGDADEKAQLLTETQRIVTHFNTEKASEWRQAHGRIRELRLQLAASLKELQDAYARGTRLDEAVAIRDAIRTIKAGRQALSDPGHLRSAGGASRILFFRVTGTSTGSVYGTDVYTDDSTLATAAVHAGVLKTGQTGVVKVTTIPTHPCYVGSTRNGIATHSWGSYPGFRVEALSDEDQDLDDGDTGGGASTAQAPEPPHRTPLAENEATCQKAPHIRKPGQPVPVTAAMPADLPAEARKQIDHFAAATADICKSARDKVSILSREAVDRLSPIQDAHTRAARLDEAIAVRDLIRTLTENSGQR